MTKRKIKKNSWKKEFLQIICLIVIIVAARYFLFSPIQVKSVSMEPTLFENDRSWSIKVGSIDRFDIVNFHLPEDTSVDGVDISEYDFIKRVVGMPGDQVEYKKDQLYINGKKLDEPFLSGKNNQHSKASPFTEDFSLKDTIGVDRVPEGCYFLMGDNRQDSYDSRNFGFVAKENILGLVTVRYWPVDRIGIIH